MYRGRKGTKMKMDREYIMRTEIKFIGGKFVGLVNGKAVVKSTNMYYVERILDGQKSDKYILSKVTEMEEDLVFRLRKRAEIRRQIADRKSVQEGKPDRLSDLLEEAANEIERLNNIDAGIDRNTDNKEYSIGSEEGYNDFIKYRNKI